MRTSSRITERLHYLAGVDEGFVMDDLQGSGDPRIPVWVTYRRPTEIKDH